MSVRIEVTEANIEHRQTTKNGKTYDFFTQTAYVFLPDSLGKPSKYPQRIEIGHDKDSPAYQPGFYTLDPRSFFVGDFNKLSVGRMKLSPLPK
jgi:hypothetical protein